ncbi:MAG: hypothetical protein SFV24_19240 [Gemmatimonadales bacterium]|nr:hypothetical protein [Gemmatimonadales bacterium]
MKQATETWLATNPEAPIAALHTGVVSFNLHILQTYWKAGRKDCAEDFLFALTAAIDYFEKEATRGEAPPT